MQLELDLRIAFAEATKLRGDESRRKHLGGGEPRAAFADPWKRWAKS